MCFNPHVLPLKNISSKRDINREDIIVAINVEGEIIFIKNTKCS